VLQCVAACCSNDSFWCNNATMTLFGATMTCFCKRDVQKSSPLLCCDKNFVLQQQVTVAELSQHTRGEILCCSRSATGTQKNSFVLW